MSEAMNLPTPSNVPAEPADLWASYSPPVGRFDEALDVTGKARPHWTELRDSLDRMGVPELTRRWEEAKQIIRENGVTYNIYGDPQGLQRPWELDPIPLLISSEHSNAISTGLVQRARLLEALLLDLYGSQQMLLEGLLPRELLFGNPGFLRACQGIELSGGRALHLYGANVARSADGTYWVLGDRAQAPSGAGYALENRIVVSRMLPDAFEAGRVHRLAVFFRNLRDTLRAIAPHNRDNPRIVLLTPGPLNETYFEHAYLARYLGYTLVEGGDLTVRDNRVYLKVLGGLQPIDVIFRRLDDNFCDPLELRPDSFLGVPGLVQAVRMGNVAVANALGSGLLESPGFLPYLPALCERLLGEELKLPSVPTFWCGDEKAREHVIANLNNFVIKPAFAGMPAEPIFAAELSKEQRDDLIRKLRAKPIAYVGQQRLTLSTAPVLVGDRLEPRSLVVRTYLAAHEDTFCVMPGGLSRVSDSPDGMVVSMQRGGGSKDTWVMSEVPVNTFTLLRPTSLPVELSRGGSALQSRVADNIYWLGRYAQRAEGLARLLRVILSRMTENTGWADAAELPSLACALSTFRKPLTSCQVQETPVPSQSEILAIIHDVEEPSSLVSVLASLARVGGTVRDRISIDMWRVVSELGEFRRREPRFLRYLHADQRQNGTGWRSYPTLSEELQLLDRTVLSLAAFGGLAVETMSRGDGWRFLDMGRKLERILHMVNLLRCTLVEVSQNEVPLLEAMLEVADSSMTYRRRYQSSLQAIAVLDLLLTDETNPRSLSYQMAGLAEDVDHLPRENTRPGRDPEQRIVLSSLSMIRLADVEELASVDEHDRRQALENLLAKLATDLPSLSDAITQHYLSHLQTSRHLAHFSPDS